MKKNEVQHLIWPLITLSILEEKGQLEIKSFEPHYNGRHSALKPLICHPATPGLEAQEPP